MKKNYFAILFLLLIACSKQDEYIPVNKFPIATDDIVNSTLTTPTVINVLGNDTTGDTPVSSTVTIIGGTDTDSNGTLDKLVVDSQGTWTVNPITGAITFTPTSTFTGNPTQISYKVKNAQGNASNNAIVAINAIPIVTADLSQVPYNNLSDYHFFIGDIKNLTPSLNVIPYEPASGLFTDYALKKRFVWMPPSVKATYMTDDKVVNFTI